MVEDLGFYFLITNVSNYCLEFFLLPRFVEKREGSTIFADGGDVGLKQWVVCPHIINFTVVPVLLDSRTPLLTFMYLYVEVRQSPSLRATVRSSRIKVVPLPPLLTRVERVEWGPPVP